jgi:hypothetical protein
MRTELLEQPASGMLVRHGPHVAYGGPTLAHVPMIPAAPARGYVLLHRDSGGGWQLFRLSGSHAQARATAGRVAKRARRKVWLGELQQSSGITQVVKALSTHEFISEAELYSRALAVAGALRAEPLEKARPPVDPYNKREFDGLVDDLADDLIDKASPTFEATVDRVIDEADINWARATDKQLDRFSKRMAVALGVAAKLVWDSIKRRTLDAALFTARSGRRAFRKTHKLDITPTMPIRDGRAVTRSVATNAHYVREFATGQMSPSLSAKARVITQRGIDAGRSSRAIGREMHRQLSAAAGGQTEAYFRMASSAINARSREFSALRSMQDAAIERWEWSSVLDEVTTETCRWLDGQVFSVAAGLARYAATDALEDPTDVRYEMPWFSEKRIRSGEHAGKMAIYIRGKERDTRVAVIEKAGFGQRDTIGTYSKTMGVKGLEQHNHSPPPAHGH